MSDPLRRRLRDAASLPSRPVDLHAVADRASQLRRGARLRQLGTAGVAAIAVIGLALRVIPSSDTHTTRVLTTPTTIATAPSPSDEVVAITLGGLAILDAADGTVLRTVAIPVGGQDPPAGPIAVDPTGRTLYVIVAKGLSCLAQEIRAVDLRTGAQTLIAQGATAPTISPDGTRLAYVPLTSPNCTATSVTVRDLRSGSEESWHVADAAMPQRLSALHWAPDGRHLVIGSENAPISGVQILDTGRPVGPDNPHTLGPRGLPAGIVNGGRYHDPAMLPNGDIVAIDPYCFGAMHCPAPIDIGNGVVTLDPVSGNVVATIIDANSEPRVQLGSLDVDPSGQVLAVDASGDLYAIIGNTLKFLAHHVSSAAWLPRSADVRPGRARATIQPAATPVGFVPVDPTFLNRQDGWALGTGPCPSGCAAIMHTADGGQTWRTAPAPSATLATASPSLRGSSPAAADCTKAPCVGRLRFADTRHAYAFGPGLFVTADGGETWTPQPSPPLAALETVGPTAVAVTEQRWPCAPGCQYTVQTSQVGDTTWTTADAPTLNGVDVELAVDGSQAIFVAAIAHTAGGAGDAHAKLLRSTDAGRTWHELVDPCGFSASGSENDTISISASPGVFAVLCQPRAPGAGVDPGPFVLASPDAGATFGPRHFVAAAKFATALATGFRLLHVGRRHIVGIRGHRHGALNHRWCAELEEHLRPAHPCRRPGGDRHLSALSGFQGGACAARRWPRVDHP